MFIIVGIRVIYHFACLVNHSNINKIKLNRILKLLIISVIFIYIGMANEFDKFNDHQIIEMKNLDV